MYLLCMQIKKKKMHEKRKKLKKEVNEKKECNQSIVNRFKEKDNQIIVYNRKKIVKGALAFHIKQFLLSKFEPSPVVWHLKHLLKKKRYTKITIETFQAINKITFAFVI